MKTLLPLALTMGWVVVVSGASPAQAYLPIWREVSLMLVRESDGHVERALTEDEIEFALEDVAVPEDESVELLLRSRGIYADAEAFGVLYHLNRGLDEESLRSARELKLPRVVGGPELLATLDEGYLVGFILDRDLKMSFLSDLREVEGLADDLLAAPPDRLGSPETVEQFAAALDSAISSFRAVRTAIAEKSRPLNPQVLQIASWNVGALKALLNDVASDGRKLDEDDVGAATFHAEETQREMAALYEVPRPPLMAIPRPPRVEVQVFVERREGDSGLPGFRVHCVMSGDLEAYEVGEEGVEVSVSGDVTPLACIRGLREGAEYCFWAEDGTRDTEVLCIVVDGEPLNLTLRGDR